MKKAKKHKWILVATASTLVVVVFVLGGCTRDGIPSLPSSTIPAKIKIQTPEIDTPQEKGVTKQPLVTPTMLELDSSMTVVPTPQKVPSAAASPSPATPLTPATLEPSAERVLEPHRLAENLTARKWQFVDKRAAGLAPEVTSWEFYPDGTFRWRFTSDYTESDVGAWAISAASEERGIIFLASAANDQGPASRFDVLSFEFRDGSLQLGEAFYQGTPFTDQDVPPPIPQEDHEAVTAPQRDRLFSLWTAMTATDWQSETTPSSGEPTMYSFRQEGTYTAHFAATQCQYSGTWSLFSSGGDVGEIRLSVPANRCDPRGPRDAFVRERPLTLSDTKLFLHQTIYVPVPK